MVEEKADKKKERQCIVMNNMGYWNGTASYCSDFNYAKIFFESELPEFIKEESKVHNDPHASDYAKKYRDKIIYLDTEEGLRLLVEEYKNLQHYVDIYESRVNDAKKGMQKLLGFESVGKYIDLHNKWYNPLIGISQDTEDKILEEIVSGKE